MREFYTVFPVLTATQEEIRDEDHIIDEAGQTFYNLTPYITSDDLAVWKGVLADMPSCDPLEGPWIMGGAVRRFLQGQPQDADIDYFFSSQTQYQHCFGSLYDHGYPVISQTGDQSTFRLDPQDLLEFEASQAGPRIQLIQKRFRKSMIDHMHAFDFTLCQTGWDGERFIVSSHALVDIVDQKINLASDTLSDLSSSWFRILKYAKQGYRPTQNTINYFMSHAHEVKAIEQAHSY